MGPVRLIGIGSLNKEHLRDSFPSATKIDVLNHPMISPGRSGRFTTLFRQFRRLFAPRYAYRSDLAFRGQLLRKIAPREEAKTLVLFRYAHPYCVSGLPVPRRSEPDTPYDLLVCVDVDDRDDQRYLARLGRIISHRAILWIAKLFFVSRLTGLLEARLSEAAHVWFAAEEDLMDLAHAKASVTPNVSRQSPLNPPTRASEQGPSILFVGVYGHDPNRLGILWFLRSCWPAIRAVCPEARFRIVGRGGWSAGLADTGLVNEGVDVIGEVDDIEAEYSRSRLVICPMPTGSGSSVKLIEACAYGRPIVATQTATRGFGSAIRDDLQVADDPKAFAENCIRLIEDPTLCDLLGSRLMATRDTYFTPEATTARVVDDLAAVLRPETERR